MNNEIMKYEELARYFCKNNIPAHLEKKDGIFYNGLISEVEADFFFIKDREDGTQLVFFLELIKLEEFREVLK